jgi:nucleoside-diphosphate-sugar epimerase
VVHCAGVTPARKKPDYAVDLRMAENVARICEVLEVPTLVSISAWVVYDPRTKPPVSEAAALMPNTAYGQSKLDVERCFKERLHSTKLVNLRASSIYGPGQRSAGLIPNLVKSAGQAGAMTIDSVNTKRDYLYIDDFTRAVRTTLEVCTDCNIDINLGSGQSRSVREVSELTAEVFADNYGTRVAIRVNPSPSDSTPLDNELAIGEARRLGLITTTTDFRRGLLAYAAWARRERLF